MWSFTFAPQFELPYTLGFSSLPCKSPTFPPTLRTTPEDAHIQPAFVSSHSPSEDTSSPLRCTSLSIRLVPLPKASAAPSLSSHANFSMPSNPCILLRSTVLQSPASCCCCCSLNVWTAGCWWSWSCHGGDAIWSLIALAMDPLLCFWGVRKEWVAFLGRWRLWILGSIRISFVKINIIYGD